MAGATVHFLLVYSFDDGKLIRQQEFREAREATEAYNAAEREYRMQDRFEIVLIGSDSIETIMKTHGHYFRSDTDSMFSHFLESAI